MIGIENNFKQIQALRVLLNKELCSDWICISSCNIISLSCKVAKMGPGKSFQWEAVVSKNAVIINTLVWVKGVCLNGHKCSPMA